MTTIIIAHKLSTIMRCDNIYILEKGSHNELIKQKGRYFNLWKEQLPEIESMESIEEKEVAVNEI